MTERSVILEHARFHAVRYVDEGDLPKAVAEFVGQCQMHRLDPPLHHASVSLAILLAEQGDEKGVEQWFEKQV
jgi:hypothetical protein